jgi:hypothetical protein
MTNGSSACPVLFVLVRSATCEWVRKDDRVWQNLGVLGNDGIDERD